MSTYVMSDIHGCYDEFIRMLAKISFSDSDQLILAGDCIDRGKQSYEMLKWMEHTPENIRIIRGNHEEEFAAYVDVMRQVDQKEELGTDFSSNKDTAALYETVQYLSRRSGFSVSYFDLYGTIRSLLDSYSIAFVELCRWADRIRKMPYYCELKVKNKICIVVHAGYADSLTAVDSRFRSLKQFYLYAREESCKLGGRPHAVVVAGHTPTVVKGEFSYNAGNVFRYYAPEKDCVFYDIDCGCAFRDRVPEAKLACIRLEDEKVFYV